MSVNKTFRLGAGLYLYKRKFISNDGDSKWNVYERNDSEHPLNTVPFKSKTDCLYYIDKVRL